MARIDGKEAARQAVMTATTLAVAAAYRAPQVTGRLNLHTEIVTGEDLTPIAEFFEAIIPVSPVMYFDFQSLKFFLDSDDPPPILLLAADLTRSELGWDCGACGFATCREFNAYAKTHRSAGALWAGPTCNWKLIDFAAACDFACAAVAQYRMDCRAMGTVGKAAASVGYLPGCSAHIGIPIGPAGDFKWFSRSQNLRTASHEMHMNWMMQTSPTNWQAFPGSTKPCIKNKQNWWQEMEYVNFSPLSEDQKTKVAQILENADRVSSKHTPEVGKWYEKGKLSMKKKGCNQ